jgi:integrase
MKPTRLTKRVLDALPLDARVRDVAVRGLFAERGRRGRVRFKIQADLRRPGERARTIRIDLGLWPDMDLDAARARAAALVADIKAGRDPRVVAPAAPGAGCWTVTEAFDSYVADIRKARGAGAERTATDMIKRRDLYLKDWAARPLSELTALDCRALHDQVIETVRARARSDRHTGARSANMLAKDLRSVWKLAVTVFPALGPCPAAAVRLAGEARAHSCIALADYPAWKRSVDDLDSPVRRCLHRVALFTGLRSSNVRALRRSWVDLEGGWIRIPGPQMKNRTPFALPLSRPLVRLLEEALRVGGDARPGSPWVFPAPSKSGHVAVTRERGWPPGHSSHGLRHSWSNAAELAGVSSELRMMLLGQRVPGVKGVYLTEGELGERLRTAQEAVSRKLLALLSDRV